MTMTKTKVDELFEQAMALTPEQREELADRLYQSTLPEVPGDGVSPEEWERCWAEEINRRIEEYERGEADGQDIDEFMAEMRAKYPARTRP
jgi:putative addiction module component (TIGR02574 family)